MLEYTDMNGVKHSLKKDQIAGVEFNDGADVLLLKDGRRIGFERNKNMFHVCGVCNNERLDNYVFNLIQEKQEALKKYNRLKWYDMALTFVVVINLALTFFAWYLK